MTKFHSKRTEIDGITFPSRLEATRFSQLKLLAKAGEISHLKLQVEFTIARAYKTADTGERMRSVVYIADFVYLDKSGRTIVEDTKGIETSTFKNKWRQCRELYPEYEWKIVKREDI